VGLWIYIAGDALKIRTAKRGKKMAKLFCPNPPSMAFYHRAPPFWAIPPEIGGKASCLAGLPTIFFIGVPLVKPAPIYTNRPKHRG